MANLSGLVDYFRRKNRERLIKRRERKNAQLRGSLAVLAIMKNEAMNIDEWISHYLQVGADRIVLIDNGSTDDTYKKAEAWVSRGVVDLISRPERHRQTDHYWEAIKTFILGKYEWLLIADLDEFWFCPDGNKVSSRLAEKQFEQTDVIYANWQLFGSSGLIDHPSSIRTALVHRREDLSPHINTKYICRTAILQSRSNIGVHKIIGGDSSRTISDNETFHLFHYPIQSLEFFRKVKMTRGDALSAESDLFRDMDYFRNYDAPCTILDRTLADLAESDRLGKVL